MLLTKIEQPSWLLSEGKLYVAADLIARNSHNLTVSGASLEEDPATSSVSVVPSCLAGISCYPQKAGLCIR